MKLIMMLLKLVVCGITLVPLTLHAAELDMFNEQAGQINIAGGTAHIPVMKQAAKAIMQQHPEIRITIAGGGSGVGAQQVGRGLVDIGNTGRPLKTSEAALGLMSYPFAVDGVAVIVHPNNPIQGLTQQQVADIFAGKITNWQIIGGADQTINLFTRDEASGTRAVFMKKMLDQLQMDNRANVVTSNGAMKTAIARDVNAIGYSSVGYIDATVKAPMLDNVKPTNAACASGEYPVVRQLYMNTKGEPQGLVKTYIDFIYSPQGAEYISAAGYIPTSR